MQRSEDRFDRPLDSVEAFREWNSTIARKTLRYPISCREDLFRALNETDTATTLALRELGTHIQLHLMHVLGGPTGISSWEALRWMEVGDLENACESKTNSIKNWSLFTRHG